MKIAFLGCGNMGGAIVQGMISSGNYQPSDIIAILPQDSPDIKMVKSKYGIEVFHQGNLPEIDYLIVAVKPQILDEVMSTLDLPNDVCVISIAAGKKTSYFRKYLPDNPLIRTMPNINAMVGHSVTVGCYDKQVPNSNKSECEKIFKSVGSFDFVDDENLMDAVTAISGSGPAYFFRFVEMLKEAAIESGLPKSVADNICINTFEGSAKLAGDSDKDISELRAAVTSKGGTTQAALDVFDNNDSLRSTVSNAIKAAVKRSKELSS
jgi:pyrroline-5-carboxylate reductase